MILYAYNLVLYVINLLLPTNQENGIYGGREKDYFSGKRIVASMKGSGEFSKIKKVTVFAITLQRLTTAFVRGLDFFQ